MTIQEKNSKNNTFELSINFIDLLMKHGLVTQDQARVIYEEKHKTKRSFVQLLREMGFLEDEILRDFMATHLGLPSFRGFQGTYLEAHTSPLKLEGVYHFSNDNNQAHIALCDATDLHMLDKIRAVFSDQVVQTYVATPAEIALAQVNCNDPTQTVTRLLEKLNQSAIKIDSTLYAALLDAILLDAAFHAASDIHFIPETAYCRLSYRLDGILQQRFLFHKNHWQPILSRIKILTRMNIMESRLPQVGRFNFQAIGRSIDCRVSAHPTAEGESLVIRLLDKFKGLINLDQLGFEEQQRHVLRTQLRYPSGLIILTGPTGSGKTTTLYAMLMHLSSTARNVMTLEDPIEYEIPHVRQTQVDEVIGLTFAEGVRSILRQDPDIILIGEIRDEATAKMALRAAMTGHLVLTTLHTNDALSAYARLVDLGVPRDLLSANINCIMSQRLVRRVCDVCHHHPPYCKACNQTGYHGRVAIGEMLVVDPEIDALFVTGASRLDIIKKASQKGYHPLYEMGYHLVERGITTQDEIDRVAFIAPDV